MLNVDIVGHCILMPKSSPVPPAMIKNLECVAFKARFNCLFFQSHQQLFATFFVAEVLYLPTFTSIFASIILLLPSHHWGSRLTILSLEQQGCILFGFMGSFVIKWEAYCQRMKPWKSHMLSYMFMILMKH
jgi:hypothetical protein